MGYDGNGIERHAEIEWRAAGMRALEIGATRLQRINEVVGLPSILDDSSAGRGRQISKVAWLADHGWIVYRIQKRRQVVGQRHHVHLEVGLQNRPVIGLDGLCFK